MFNEVTFNFPYAGEGYVLQAWTTDTKQSCTTDPVILNHTPNLTGDLLPPRLFGDDEILLAQMAEVRLGK